MSKFLKVEVHSNTEQSAMLNGYLNVYGKQVYTFGNLLRYVIYNSIRREAAPESRYILLPG
jgi:hypothetical protein